MPAISIINVVSVTTSTPPAGAAPYQINNLAIFTRETPENEDMGDYGVYLTPREVAADWGFTSEAYAMADLVFSQTPNIFNGEGRLIISRIADDSSLALSIEALRAKVFFGGALWAGYSPSASDITDAAEYCQFSRILLYANSSDVASIDDGGILVTLSALGLSQSRLLLYTVGDYEARLFAAAYASRGQSVNFSGNMVTATMHMKTLYGVAPDPGITQTILNKCKTVGVDTYAKITSPGKVFCTKGNGFFDDVYNLNWLVFSLEVAGFNAIATTSTKVPLTDSGVAALKGAYLKILNRAVSNGYLAPGVWNSAERFGDPADMLASMRNNGYYIYAAPIARMSQADRAARKAPLIQISVKLAGAIHSTNVVIFTDGGNTPNKTARYYLSTEQSFTASCPFGYEGNPVTATIPAHAYKSTVSQAVANQKALNAAIELANSELVCLLIYYNTEQSYTAHCPTGYTGENTAIVPAGTYSSTDSQAAVNATALAAATAEAEAGLVCVINPPAAPTDFTGEGWSESVNLSWSASATASSYNVKRATVNGGPYTTIASGVVSTSYADSTAVSGTTYYYVVSAVNAGGESSNSSQITLLFTRPRAYLKFNEGSGTTAADSTGNGWTGTLVNGTTWQTGRSADSVGMNASSQYVSLPAGAVNGLTNFTIALWANLSVTAPNWSRLFDFGSNATVNMFLTPNAGGSNNIRFAITLGGNPAEQRINGASALPTTGWHHVAVTLSGNTGTLYVDGVQVGQNSSMTLNPSSLGNTTQNWIGRSQYVVDPYLNGRVDEFRIYSRALSGAEVVSLMTTSPLGLIAASASLGATAGTGQISLSWSAVSGATSYDVMRGAATGGPYSAVATGVSGASYVNTGLTAGLTYYYVIVARSATSESINSPQASATVM